jgi:hypothetical protein
MPTFAATADKKLVGSYAYQVKESTDKNNATTGLKYQNALLGLNTTGTIVCISADLDTTNSADAPKQIGNDCGLKTMTVASSLGTAYEFPSTGGNEYTGNMTFDSTQVSAATSTVQVWINPKDSAALDFVIDFQHKITMTAVIAAAVSNIQGFTCVTIDTAAANVQYMCGLSDVAIAYSAPASTATPILSIYMDAQAPATGDFTADNLFENGSQGFKTADKYYRVWKATGSGAIMGKDSTYTAFS